MGIIGTVARMLGIKPVRTLAEKRLKLLSVLERGERAGRRLRQSMEQAGYKTSGPAFYGMSARMMDDGLIELWTTKKKIGDIPVYETWMRITDKGRKILEESRNAANPSA